MLKITIACVGRLKERFYIDAADEYLKRLSGYCSTDVIELSEYRLPAKPSASLIMQALGKERDAVVGKIPAASKAIALCVEGRELSSPELLQLLFGYASSGTPHLCFIIGGSFGLHESVKNGADFKLSLSKMTFPHNLARIILLEQLYRVFKISEGGKYHK